MVKRSNFVKTLKDKDYNDKNWVRTSKNFDYTNKKTGFKIVDNFDKLHLVDKSGKTAVSSSDLGMLVKHHAKTYYKK